MFHVKRPRMALILACSAAVSGPGLAQDAPVGVLVRARQSTRHRGAQAPRVLCARIGARWGLPPGLLWAVVMEESRGHVWALGTNRNGSCDVGLAQINVPGCDPLRIIPLFEPSANLTRAARILRWSERSCRRRPWRRGCRHCRWGRYNPGSPSWCGKVLDRWRRLGNAIAVINRRESDGSRDL